MPNKLKKLHKPLFGKYIVQIEWFEVPKPIRYNFAKQFMTDKLLNNLKNQKQ